MSWFKMSALPPSHDDDGNGGKESVELALTMPATGIDPDWREQISLTTHLGRSATNQRSTPVRTTTL